MNIPVNNHKTLIIGLAGYKGSGKDTAAEYMAKHFKKPVFVNFADPVKFLIEYTFGIDSELLKNPATKERKLYSYPFQTPRYIMQKFATECFRKYWPDVWINYWERQIIQLICKQDNPDVIFVTDLRFPNEFEMVKKYNSLILKIDRKEVYPWQMKYSKFIRLFLPRVHKSERYVEKVPYMLIINNNGSKISLEYELDKLLKIMERK